MKPQGEDYRIGFVFFLLNFYFQKIYQLKEQQRIEILHDDGLRQQYDAKLLQELQQLRAQNEQEMQLLREEIAIQYEKKVRIESNKIKDID